MLIDSADGRSITALVGIDELGKMLGDNFVEFVAADQARSICFVNRMAWVSITSHPQIAGVSQINFANRRPLGVAGSVILLCGQHKRAATTNTTECRQLADTPRNQMIKLIIFRLCLDCGRALSTA
ncbi:hypothetical protein [Bradyrhizobium icense]|uniref:Uncharacterized protein n=1 Tax=Bradyrhizobium icense TaxID=1274631 RepID=A0A1B1UDG4_9BRAD|nr:hypothetical protein [Bradyrhizobium icense]ANW00803.1 hypothetical protein LMTR13_12085 [Bradyrhizobium icense]